MLFTFIIIICSIHISPEASSTSYFCYGDMECSPLHGTVFKVADPYLQYSHNIHLVYIIFIHLVYNGSSLLYLIVYICHLYCLIETTDNSITVQTRWFKASCLSNHGFMCEYESFTRIIVFTVHLHSFMSIPLFKAWVCVQINTVFSSSLGLDIHSCSDRTNLWRLSPILSTPAYSPFGVSFYY